MRTPESEEFLIPLPLVEFKHKFLVPARKTELIATMLACKNGWAFVGWNRSDYPSGRASYVCMFDHKDEDPKWFQLTEESFCLLADTVKERTAR